MLKAPSQCTVSFLSGNWKKEETDRNFELELAIMNQNIGNLEVIGNPRFNN